MRPLQERSGRAANFTFGDLLALGVIHRLTVGLDMAVSSLQPAALALFTICNEGDWTRPDDRFLFVTRRLDATGGDFAPPMIELGDRTGWELAAEGQAVMAIIPLGPILEQLRTRLLTEPQRQGTQQALPFPPLGLKSRSG